MPPQLRSQTWSEATRGAASEAASKADANVRKLSVSSLSDPHRDIFEKALRRILSTDVAELTFAQIADGLPIAAVAKDSFLQVQHPHPLYKLHQEVCAGAVRKVKELRDNLHFDVLKFTASLIHGFNGAAPGSRIFQTLLVEMVARAIHQLTTQLHQLQLNIGCHTNDGLASWVPDKDDELWWRWHPDGRPPPTLFWHTWYRDYDLYINGISDGVGYWAESRILGGVVLFDRRDPKEFPGADPTAIYFHPDRGPSHCNVTYRICKLTDEQRHTLLDFLTSKEVRIKSPFPILPNDNNRTRVDPEDPIRKTGIYRDLDERRELGPNDYDCRLRDVYNTLDWLTDADWNKSSGRAHNRRDAWDEERREKEEKLRREKKERRRKAKEAMRADGVVRADEALASDNSDSSDDST